MRTSVGSISRVVFRWAYLGQPEVENLDPSIFRDEQVLGLEIAMHDAFVMRRRQAVGDLHGVIDGLATGLARAAGARAASRRRAARTPCRRRHVRRHLVNGKNVGMVQRCGGTGFLLEAAQAVRVGGRDSGRTLMATSRSRRVSCARYTSPIPPAPSGERISYCPRIVPGVRGMRGSEDYTLGSPHLNA